MNKEMGITAKWRNHRLHRKCLFCVFCHVLPECYCAPTVWHCNCKEKAVNPDIIRPFCSCFQGDTKRCEEVDKVFYEGMTPSEAKNSNTK